MKSIQERTQPILEEAHRILVRERGRSDFSIGDILEWLGQRIEDGCTDVKIYRLRDSYSVQMHHANIPGSRAESKTMGDGPDLLSALEDLQAQDEKRGAA